MYHALYGNLRPWSVIPNESSFGKIAHVEQGIKQSFLEFYKVLATVMTINKKRVITVLIIIICLSVIILFCCFMRNNHQIIDSDKLLPSTSGEVDHVTIYDFHTSEERRILSQEKIDELLKMLSGFELKKLSTDDENELIGNSEMLYSIFFTSLSKPQTAGVVGAVVFFSSGEMYVVDTDTMDVNYIKRTESYFYQDETFENFENIFRCIESFWR
jgi:hypothetical protein